MSELAGTLDWTSDLDAQIDALIDRHRDDGVPPLATLDFDNTCLHGDSGEVLHYHLCETLSYALDDDAFWATIAPEDGRDRLYDHWQRLRRLTGDRRQDVACQEGFDLDLIGVWLRHFQRLGPQATFDWAVTLHAGLSPDQVQTAAAHMFQREAQRPVGRRSVAIDAMTLHMSQGLRVRPEVRGLIQRLTQGGFDVWLVSATNVWTVQALAPLFGLAPHRVIGNSCHVEGGRITARRDGPTTYLQGKLEAIDVTLGRRPVFAMGDSWSDSVMMEAAETALLVDRGDLSLRAYAAEQGWLEVRVNADD